MPQNRILTPFEVAGMQRKQVAWERAYLEGYKLGVMYGDKLRVEAFKLFRVALAEAIGEKDADEVMLKAAEKMDQMAKEAEFQLKMEKGAKHE